MGKIRGWRLTQKTKRGIDYESKRRHLMIRYNPYGAIHKYKVLIWDVKTEDYVTTRLCKTKKDAEKFATRYMRAHPRG